jgi:hypothetical protein
MELLPINPPKFNGMASEEHFFVLIRTVLICLGLSALLALWLFDRTDVPYIEKRPAIPAIPILGNVVQLGTEQPRRPAELSRKYGPVFQIRLGNHVRHLSFALKRRHRTDQWKPEIRGRKQL